MILSLFVIETAENMQTYDGVAVLKPTQMYEYTQRYMEVIWANRDYIISSYSHVLLIKYQCAIFNM